MPRNPFVSEDALFREFEQWKASQPEAPSLCNVLATNNGRLIGVYILQRFRRATVEAGRTRNRVARVRSVVLEAYRGDEEKTEGFLRRRHPLLGGRSPLQHAVDSEAGADAVIRLIGEAQNGSAV